MSTIRRHLVGIASAALIVAAHAQPTNITAGEMALTPPVCQDVQAMPTGWVQHFRHSPRAPYWESVLGKTFWAMHHYCWALIHLQRAARPGVTKQARDHMIRVAIRDYYYVIAEAQRAGEYNFVMLPELYYRAGEAYVQLQEYAAAIEEFEKSRRAKADYWPPYVAQAQVHVTLGMRNEARALLEQGLQLMPGESNLLSAVDRLTGSSAADARAPTRGRTP